MGGLSKFSAIPCLGIWTILVSLLSMSTRVFGADTTQWIPYSTDQGTVYLDSNRQPALFTGAFGDCQGNSLINVTRFDASLYRDNLTVMFHVLGTTPLKNEKVMMFLSVYAYGENRFDLTFNPCTIGTPTLCPLNSSVPVEANGLLPIGPSDIAGVPDIAFQIPDFEGQAILRIFSNTTQSQIACYSAVMSNGASFSHPAAVGSILGIFTIVALVSSLAVAVYGQVVPETRKHYAHSMSVFVVFSVFQHIFFTGALSVNWPSVLVAFWSNYAWAAGMIYTNQMQKSIDRFIGNNFGNISTFGAAPSNQNSPTLGGGYDLSSLYKRNSPEPAWVAESIAERIYGPRGLENSLHRRYLPNTTSGFTWYGNTVAPGLPLPGNYSSFAGTLAELNIPASNAFLTGLLWLLILIVIIVALIVAIKWSVEALAKMKLVRTDRLEFFRSHWLQFTAAAVLRTCYIAFFMVVFLSLFQFTLGGAKGVLIIAAVILAVFLLGLFGTAAYALWYRLRRDKTHNLAGRPRFVFKKHARGETHDSISEVTQHTDKESTSTQLPKSEVADVEGRPHAHDDASFTVKFGWMASRFRRSKWWFFSVWLVYELVRACFYGGAAGHPLTQVFGLLAWEIISLVAIVIMRPFESSRLNLLMVYFLGFSKVVTVALSSAFDPRFNLGRILCTVIGVIIIVIQGVLTICLMISIILGAISSYLSITRDSEDFKPKSWEGIRTRYLAHVDLKDTDRPAPPPPPEPERPKDPYFAVTSIRRELKIEDEGPKEEELFENIPDIPDHMSVEPESDVRSPVSRSQSIRSRTSTSNLPFGARPHRASWSVQDFQELNSPYIVSPRPSRMSLDSMQSDSRVGSVPDLPSTRPRRSQSLLDAANPELRSTTPRLNDLQSKSLRRNRGNSMSLKSKAHQESVAEDVENEIQPVPEIPKALSQ